MDPAAVNGKFTMCSDEQLPRADGHSRGSGEQSIAKICDLLRKMVYFGISQLNEIKGIARRRASKVIQQIGIQKYVLVVV